MIAVDTNVLVYAHRADSDRHREAVAIVRGLCEGRVPWAIPWPCIHEFLAVVTRERGYSPPSTISAAFSQLDVWLESPSCLVIGESTSHYGTLRSLAGESDVAGSEFHDAKIAAICLDHGVTEILTNDRGFGRFTGLNARDPFVSD